MSKVELDTLYGINKQLYAKITPSEEKTNELLNKIHFCSHCGNYYMLLCREKNDYTILHTHSKFNEQAVQEVKEVLQSRGTIIDINYSEEFQFYECWIREESEEIYMYALFPCQDWVIEIE